MTVKEHDLINFSMNADVGAYRYYDKEKDNIINNGIKAFIKQVTEEILRTKVLPF